jgi:hypothetical protein
MRRSLIYALLDLSIFRCSGFLPFKQVLGFGARQWLGQTHGADHQVGEWGITLFA